MPSREQILATLIIATNQGVVVAAIWHLLAALGLALAVTKPLSRRTVGLFLLLPLLSVSIASWYADNLFNGAVFGILVLLLVPVMMRLSANQRFSMARDWRSGIGIVMLAFGLFYPHFLQHRPPFSYVYAAPFALIPCPTLAVVLGVLLISSGLGSRLLSWLLTSVALFYGVFGWLYLGVTIDFLLVLGAGSLALQSMKSPRHRHFATQFSLAMVILAGTFYYAFRPWYEIWGTTPNEQRQDLAGDFLLPDGALQETRAVTINAPPEKVWPWLAQLGQDRGGFYSYRILENVVGCQMPDVRELEPDLQKWHHGDKLWMYPQDRLGGRGYAQLLVYEPGKSFAFGTWFSPQMDNVSAPIDGTWTFQLIPTSPEQTRLLVRSRTRPIAGAQHFFNAAIFGPMHFVMERKMMETIKARAENRTTSERRNNFEVIAWVMVAGFFLAAVGLLFLRPGLRTFSGVLLTGLTFQMLTFLQPGPLVASACIVLLALWLQWRSPPRLRRSSLLDELFPDYDFSGHVAIATHQSPRNLMNAFRTVTIEDMPGAKFMGDVRYLPQRLRKKTNQPRTSEPFFRQLIRESHNIVILERPEHEVVIGCIGKFHQVLDQETVALDSAGQFFLFNRTGYQKLIISFRILTAPGDDGQPVRQIVLEDRTKAIGTKAFWAFALYWLLIKPFGHLAAWLFLRAIRKRARQTEAGQFTLPAMTASV